MRKLDPVRYRLEDAVVEAVEVPSRDGLNTLWVDIIRPRTDPGVRVPTIMEASPYYNSITHCKTPTREPATPNLCSDASAFPQFYDEYFVPRGYAVALMDLRGTRNSSGCQSYGARNEVRDAVDVVDWIADQSWSNGKVGLTGGSYDGTIASGVAVEQPLSGRHPAAVPAVIPIRAIDRWYDYHFFNGVPSGSTIATSALFTTGLAAVDNPNSGTPRGVVATAQRKGCIATFAQLTNAGYAPTYQDADSAFWAERDFRKDARTTRAAFFLIHGLYDTNVAPHNATQMWAALPPKAPKKLWLFNGDHTDPDYPTRKAAEADGMILPFPFQQAYRTATHRWWAQFLKGMPAGALDTPAVELQDAHGRWSGSRSWPRATAARSLRFHPDGSLSPAAPVGSVSWSDDPTSVLAPEERQFLMPSSSRAVHLSGEVMFDLSYELTGPDTSIEVRIDVMPPGAADDAPVADAVLDELPTAPFTLSYAWMRSAYRSSLAPRGASTPHRAEPSLPGEQLRTRFASLPVEFTLSPGYRLRFTFSAGGIRVIPTGTGGEITLHLGPVGSQVTLPVRS